MPRGLKFGLIGCGGLVALGVLLVGCAAILGGGSSITETDPATFLGKPTTDPEVQEYLSQNECASINMSWLCYRSGVEFSYDTGSNVRGIFYYLQDDGGAFQPYEGPLPGGLSASDTKADVDRKLGPPQGSFDIDEASYPPQVPGTNSLNIQFAPVGTPMSPDSSIDRVSFSSNE